MGTVIKVPASDAMLADLEEMKQLLGTSTTAETVRRAVARELLLLRALNESQEIVLQGKKKDGKKLHVLM